MVNKYINRLVAARSTAASVTVIAILEPEEAIEIALSTFFIL